MQVVDVAKNPKNRTERVGEQAKEGENVNLTRLLWATKEAYRRPMGLFTKRKGWAGSWAFSYQLLPPLTKGC